MIKLIILLVLLNFESRAVIRGGVDDRSAVTELDTPNKKATVMAVRRSDIKMSPDGKTFRLQQQKARDAFGLCGIDDGLEEDQKFADKPVVTGLNCAGMVLAEKFVAVSAHCADEYIDPEMYCRDFVFISGVTSSNSGDEFNVKDHMFGCKKVAADGYQKAAKAGPAMKKQKKRHDWMIAVLERKVPGTAGVDWKSSKPVEDNQQVYSVGHPLGIPMIKAPGKVTFRDPLSGTVRTDFDASPGFSGGPVFDKVSGKYQGILATDFRYRDFHLDDHGCAYWAHAPLEDDKIFFKGHLTGSTFVPLSTFRNELINIIAKENGIVEQLQLQRENLDVSN